MHKFQIPGYCLLLILFACGSSNPDSDNEEYGDNAVQNEDLEIPVHITPVIIGSFPLQMQVNGTVQAFQRVEIKLRANGRIEEMPFKEGDYVQSGALLSKQEDEALRLQLDQYRIQFEKAVIELNDLIIGQGGDEGDTNSVTPKHLRNFRLMSGWDEARHNIRQTEYDIDQTAMFAPISGWISDIRLKQYQEGVKGDVLCSIINPASFEVHFSILESENIWIRTGQPVRFSVLGNPSQDYTGKIIRFNPVIDQNGLTTVIASIDSGKMTLREGMKVRVTIEKHIADQIIVPKEARVIRSDRDVVFTADTTVGLAKWNYVTITNENGTHITIEEGLSHKDLVIVDGNLNLDHDAQIRIDSFIK